MINVTARVGGGIGSLKRVEHRSFVLPDGATLAELIEIICSHFGDEVGQDTALVVINGRLCREPERAGLVLHDGDVISVLRAFAGG